MDSKKGIKNVVTSIVFKILTIVLHLFAIRSIDFIGSSYLGYNSLFNSIIDVISLTECGFAGGVAFCLYKAIVDKDENKIIGLYSYLKKAYLVIFVLFVCLGLLILPNISILNADLDNVIVVPPEIYFSYLMYILSAALIYLFGFKATTISAYKNTYKREFAFSVGVIVQYSLQILFAYLTKSFVLCSISLVVGTLFQWLIITLIFRKDHKELLLKKNDLSSDEKKVVRTYIFSSFAHHLGDIILYSTDGIIISAFLGTVTLAGYYRYTSIISAIFSVSTLLFTSLTSVVGHSFAKENKEKMVIYFKVFYCANFIIGSILFAGFFGASDSFVAFFYGEANVISYLTVLLLSSCYFLRFMQRTCLLFRDASGSFRNDWYKPIIESLLNLILDFVLVKVFGVNGVIIATIITLVLVSHVIEPLVLYKCSFGKRPIKYYLVNYSLAFLFVAELFVILFVKNMLFGKISFLLGFFVLGFASVIIAGMISIPLFVYARASLKKVRDFKYENA